MKSLADYLYYEEENPSIRIYLGDMIASWYNTLITRGYLWVNEKVISKLQNISQSVKGLVIRAGIGLGIKFPKKVAEQELCDYIKILGLALFVGTKNQNDIILTETPLTMINQTLKLLVENAIWSLMEDLQNLQRWLLKQVLSVEQLLEKLSLCKPIVNEVIYFQELIQVEREYAKYV